MCNLKGASAERRDSSCCTSGGRRSGAQLSDGTALLNTEQQIGVRELCDACCTTAAVHILPRVKQRGRVIALGAGATTVAVQVAASFPSATVAVATSPGIPVTSFARCWGSRLCRSTQ